jgi:uncharacterized protein DUF4347
MIRLLVFDRTAPALRHAWRTGAVLYRRLGRIDAAFGATSWDEALSWLAQAREPIGEIQYWGHGRWGRALVAGDALDASALRPGHRLNAGLQGLRERLAPDALVWLRTCEAFGANAGHEFAMRLADWLGARVAGHTFVIGVMQSGLHGLLPGHAPDWPAEEGLAEGTPASPVRARGSAPRQPRTITCFDGRVPSGWFA